MNSHILRAPETTTEAEGRQLKQLDKHHKRYLSKRVCFLCDKPLDQVGCGSVYEACPEPVRIERRNKCLKEYKPRLQARKNKEPKHHA